MVGKPGSRLRRAREAAGFASAKDAAIALSSPVSTYLGHENGSRGYPAKKAALYAQFFRVPEEWLLFGKGSDAIDACEPSPSSAVHQFEEDQPHYLREWRLHRGISQARLAKLVGATHQQIGNLERGERSLTGEWLSKFADALGTTRGVLLDHHPSEVSGLLEIWSQIDEEDRKQAARTLGSFIRI